MSRIAGEFIKCRERLNGVESLCSDALAIIEKHRWRIDDYGRAVCHGCGNNRPYEALPELPGFGCSIDCEIGMLIYRGKQLGLATSTTPPPEPGAGSPRG